MGTGMSTETTPSDAGTSAAHTTNHAAPAGATSAEAAPDTGTASGRDDAATARGSDVAPQPARERRSSRGRKHTGRGKHRGGRSWPGFAPEQLATRAASVPALVYPEELPVSARRQEIAEAISTNQVVIVAGETGSGKTTQLPKICLELGRGITGMIGHTQPRRIAARSVAERIAHELGTAIGRDGVVGYQVRFTEETGPNTLVKLMTDGILLAEIQTDPMLRRYDTIIVDEAHERSLNIDFILGYLARLLPQRPDLKVIITSATIDSERFAAHFAQEVTREGEAGLVPSSGEADDDAAGSAPHRACAPLTARVPAPVIQVSGRTYPVEIRYRPLLADDGLGEVRDPNRHAGGHVPQDDAGSRPAAAGQSALSRTDIDALSEAELEALTAPEPAPTRPADPAVAPASNPGAPMAAAPAGELTDAELAALTSPDPAVRAAARARRAQVRAAGQARTSASAASTSSPWQPNVDGRQAASAGTAASSPAALQPPPARPAPHSHTPTEDRDQVTGILDAVDELMAAGPGDILVFLAGERDIRDTESALIDHLGPRYTMDGRTRTPGAVEVVPLYSRLTAAEQHRVFEAHSCRRIVLATNVAETSLTVPGIRYVIDPGLARISRYSNRTKVQRLPIEPISQASANQRSGRCGRVADGIAIRLYSEADYLSRPEYTEPEILRTSLASVILQMANLGLGAVEDFPFLDAPDHRAVRDGIQLLTEIGAIEPSMSGRSGRSSRGPRLTEVGRRLARLPIDPRLGRMLLRAGELGCAGEVMVIVAALSIQDVRERPLDKQEQADALHRRFADPTSDFLTYLNLWRYLRTQSRELSGSAFRRMCKAEFLHYLRVREWQDVHTQLRQLSRPLGLDAAPVELPTARSIRAARQALEPGSHAAQIAHGDVAAAVVALGKSADTPDADAIHRSLLVGLLSNVGHWDERRREYSGARGTRFMIWPGSGLRRKTYDWVMTAELVETSHLFARTVAKVDSRWVEETARQAGLLRQVFGEPYWSTKNGCAMVHEKVMVYGMTLAADRPATLASVGTPAAREVAREMFLRSGLVEGGWHARHGFVSRNRDLIEELSDVEQRRREHGLLASDEALYRFYDDRVPDEVTGANDFDAWWRREKGRHPHLLDYTRELLLPGADEDSLAAGYPDAWVQGDLTLGLDYVFEPGQADDGVSVLVPVEVLGRLEPAGFDWLVPGMRAELVVATIRALPKRVRRQLVPAPDVGAQVWAAMREEYQTPAGASAPPASFQEAFTAAVARLRGVEVTEADWAEAQEHLPDHLRVSFVALDSRGREIGRGKDLVALQKRLSGRTEAAVRSAVRGALAQAMAEAQDRERSRARRGKKGRAKGNDAAAAGRAGRPAASSAGSGTQAGGTARATGTGGKPGAGLRSGLAERKGLTDWPKDVPGLDGSERSTIPPTVESTGTAGLVVRGYPTLVAAGPTTADLTILPDAQAQERAHGEGVTALALARTQLPVARVTSRWRPKEILVLAASPYSSTEALVADLQLAAARTVAAQWERSSGRRLAEVRERAVFEELVALMRQDLEDEVYRVAQVVARALSERRAVDKAVEAHTSLALLSTLQQVREHAATLVYPGFVSATPAGELVHLPRFLQALAIRVDKAESSPSQDAALAYQVTQAEEMLAQARQRAAGLPDDAEREAVLVQARWLIEELRVSLFAQTLGTSQKVSLQRVSKLLAKV